MRQWISLIAVVSVCSAVLAAPADISDTADLLKRGAAAANGVHTRVGELMAESPHPLFARHLRSVDALVWADWARAALTPDIDQTYLKRSVEYAEKILEGLNGDAGKWASYAAGRRSLIVSFVSWYDQSLQQYSLRLPTDWDPEKTYPMIVYLHGHVPNVHPMWYTSLSFGPGAKPGAKSKDDGIEPHFSLGPWGRGNTGYRDAGEEDVWEAFDDVLKRFKVDEDRICLTGHSMGGMGTWGIGVRTPDRWSAMAIYAGADRNAPLGLGVAENLKGMPILIWHGVKDRAVPIRYGYALRDGLKEVGNEVKMIVRDQAGHMVTGADKPGMKTWLLQHRRRRPDTFSFVADTALHTGAWGVTMHRDPLTDPLPRFECVVEGNTVRIDSTGTDGLNVKLGEGGLGLAGDVTVVWNGKTVYEGPVKDVSLGAPVRHRWARRRR